MSRRTLVALRTIPLERIRANPDNARQDLGDLTELARSLRIQGQLQPIIVAPEDEDFLLLDGHRRHAAGRLAGLNHMMALVTDRAGTLSEQLATMLAASMHKELTPMEQARAFRRLRQGGVSVEDIAAASGFSASTVRKRLDWMLLPPEAQGMVEAGELSLGQADTLARQVRSARSGSTARGRRRAVHLNSQHACADTTREMCTHQDTDTVLGAVACSRCWEAAIRADERAASPMDLTTVHQAVDGDLDIAGSLNAREREEAVRILTDRGLTARTA